MATPDIATRTSPTASHHLRTTVVYARREPPGPGGVQSFKRYIRGKTPVYDEGMKPERVLSWSDAASADWALVQECAAGEETACTRLVTDHQRMVYQLALHLLGEPQEALDLSQEVFLRVFRTLHQFRGQSTLKTWIYRIVINQASNRQRWWRRRHRAQQVPIDDPARGAMPLVESRNFAMPDRVLDEREVADRVWRAVGQLPFDQRTVVV